MYNYEYAPSGYETNYEFNPEHESGFEMQNFENEFGNEYEMNPESNYEMNPEFNMEQNYETQNQYEDEWPRNVVVRDHRTFAPSRPGSVVVPTRPGINYRLPYSRPGSYYKPAPAYRRYPYSRYRRPNPVNRNYGPRRYPWNNWRNRYRGPWGANLNTSNINQYQGQQYPQSQGQQYPQGPDSGGQSAPNTGGGSTGTGNGGGIPNNILDTIQKLSQQIAATNASVAALQQSMAGANKPDTAAPPPPDNSQAPATPGTGQQSPSSEYEMGNYEYGMGNELGYEYGMGNETGNYEYNNETGNYEYGMGNEMENYEYNNETMNYEDENNEMMEMELAAELLATNNEMELDHFLGGLVSGTLGKLVKTVVKKTLPIAGAAAGAFFGGPLGAKVGNMAGKAVADAFELELEGLSNEDREFEVARAIIRLATDAAQELAESPGTGDPNQDAKNALIQSAIRNAPGLLVRKNRNYQDNEFGGGRWHRRGKKIVIENAF